MVTGKQIHNWLQAPGSLTEQDYQSTQQIHVEYPYFAPAALLLQYYDNGNQRNRSIEELYNYNPIIFHYWNHNEFWQSPTKPKLKNWEALNESLLEHEKDGVDKDYFDNVPDEFPVLKATQELESGNNETLEPQSLMVVMSFAEWLQFLQKKTRLEQEEEEEKRALRTQWQKMKMAEAIEEGSDEIPETVFEMAVNSISRDEAVISESMALVYVRQGKVDEAIIMYKKLSLKNPEKSIYFADKINNLKKEI